MVISSHNIFGCPVCGFRVGQGSDCCPRCGHEFLEDTKLECPFCGELVEQGIKECPSCHVNYTDFREKTEARGGDDSVDSLLEELISLESTSVKKEDKKFSCPKCAWLLDGSESACPKCGMKFSEEVSFHCPICGYPVSSQAKACPECGISLVASDTAEDKDRDFMRPEKTESRLDEIITAASLLKDEESVSLPPEEQERPHLKEEEELKPLPATESKVPVPEDVVEMPLEKAPEEVPKEPGAGYEGILEDLEEMDDKQEKAPPKKKPRQRKLKAKSSAKKK